MLAALNENNVSAAAVIIGSVSALVRPTRRWVRKRSNAIDGRCWQSQKVALDFINGSTVVPFTCLVASAFYPGILPLVVANKATMAIAGAIGLIFVVGEILTAGRDD